MAFWSAKCCNRPTSPYSSRVSRSSPLTTELSDWSVRRPPLDGAAGTTLSSAGGSLNDGAAVMLRISLPIAAFASTLMRRSEERSD